MAKGILSRLMGRNPASRVSESPVSVHASATSSEPASQGSVSAPANAASRFSGVRQSVSRLAGELQRRPDARRQAKTDQALRLAARLGDFQALNKHLEKGAHPNALPTHRRSIDAGNGSALHEAARRGDVNALRVLVRSGGDMTHINPHDSRTPKDYLGMTLQRVQAAPDLLNNDRDILPTSNSMNGPDSQEISNDLIRPPSVRTGTSEASSPPLEPQAKQAIYSQIRQENGFPSDAAQQDEDSEPPGYEASELASSQVFTTDSMVTSSYLSGIPDEMDDLLMTGMAASLSANISQQPDLPVSSRTEQPGQSPATPPPLYVHAELAGSDESLASDADAASVVSPPRAERSGPDRAS